MGRVSRLSDIKIKCVYIVISDVMSASTQQIYEVATFVDTVNMKKKIKQFDRRRSDRRLKPTKG